MSYRRGSGYFGSNEIKISTSNQEIIQQHKPVGSSTLLDCYKFSFINYNAPCHIKINGSENQIYIAQSQGFEIDLHDMELKFFVIVESGINYSYVGAY